MDESRAVRSMRREQALQPLADATAPDCYVPATTRTTMWGRLPCAADAPVLSIEPGERVTLDTASHEGILEDQGRDPVAFFAGHGVDEADVLLDAIELAAHGYHDPTDGPHVITGPVDVRGVGPGDLIAVPIEALEPRLPYGIDAVFGMEPALAYAYLSAATDFEISQVVDIVKGSHARIRRSDFAHLTGRALR